jgi:toxin ParE1/3/4
MTEVIWSRRATENLIQHVAYIAARNPDAAERVRNAIASSVETLSQFPYRGRASERTGTRELVIPEFPNYIVVYRVTETHIQILRVWHGRQDWQ